MLTPRQEQILSFIKEFPHSYAPTVREIGEAVGLSGSIVQGYLNDLVHMGFIERKPSCRRCIILKEPTA